jgi:hypothetical protein
VISGLSESTKQAETLAKMRSLLLFIITAGLLATEVELLLLGHLKPVLQAFPVLLIFLALAMVVWHVKSGNTTSVRIFQGTMFLCVITGIVGTLIHYIFDIAWTATKDPTLHGFALYKTALGSQAPPVAPAVMVQLGLLGLLYTFRHPALDVGLTEEFHSITKLSR